ncbi:uncharacterized protein LOC132707522 isoform X2 [Cylas formicarius]|uniref:uncharacterized protein LOC132707522 isoform X2 n=1 Tax=Cylas formicarius TaxID=197179 RepID=UPI0029583752|nr:uncharacterized protein LOC132707522 isoform X2 [Cylas formicarius]
MIRFYCFLLFLFFIRVRGNKSIEVLTVQKCDVSGQPMDFDINMDYDKKTGNFRLKTANEINEDYIVSATIEQMINDEYVFFADVDNTLCEIIDACLKTAWEKARSAMEPRIEESCTILPGEYSLKDFSLSKDEVKMPVEADGQFKAKISLFDPNENEVACLIVEVITKY